jgi:hypothetical protein
MMTLYITILHYIVYRTTHDAVLYMVHGAIVYGALYDTVCCSHAVYCIVLSFMIHCTAMYVEVVPYGTLYITIWYTLRYLYGTLYHMVHCTVLYSNAFYTV